MIHTTQQLFTREFICPTAMENRNLNNEIYFAEHSHLLGDYPSSLEVICFPCFLKKNKFLEICGLGLMK